MDNNKYIAGHSMKPSSDIDDDYYETQMEDAENNYDANDLIDSFDNDNFETIFKLNYNDILTFKPEDIQVVCSMMIAKIDSSLNYQFTPKLVFDNIEAVIEFFDFIRFIKFNNISFLQKLLGEMDISIDGIVKYKSFDHISNSKIINYVDNISDHYKYNRLIFDFITTHNREDLIKWLNSQFMKNKSEILLDIIQID